jgi:hypothetical protein
MATGVGPPKKMGDLELEYLRRTLRDSIFAPSAFFGMIGKPPGSDQVTITTGMQASGIANFLIECAQETGFPIEWFVDYDADTLCWQLKGDLPGYGNMSIPIDEQMFVMLRRHAMRPFVLGVVRRTVEQLVLSCDPVV